MECFPLEVLVLQSSPKVWIPFFNLLGVYLQQDGAAGEAELDAVLGGVVPRQQLQVLDGAVGQRRLHVTRGLQRRETCVSH